mgnify:CR=1 FL=1
MAGFLTKLKTAKTAPEIRDCPIHDGFGIRLVKPDQETLDAEVQGSRVIKKGRERFVREKWAPIYVKNRFRGWFGMTPEIFFGYLEMPYAPADLQPIFDANGGELPYTPEDAATMLLKVYDHLVVVPVNDFIDDWTKESTEADAAVDSKSA